MTHVLGVLHGLGAAAACAALFYLAGLVLTRRRWDALLGSASLPLIGAAFYVIACWVAVTARHTPLTHVTAGCGVFVAALTLVRIRRVAASVATHAANPALAAGVCIFAAFYVLAYAMARPPSADLFVPAAWPGHIDLFTQARYAKHLLLSGSPDLEGATFNFRRSPAVTVMLAAWSMFYRLDPLDAALSLRFAVAALLGVTAAGTVKSQFRLSMRASLVIAGVVMTSAYVSDIARAYRLETLMAVPVFLYLAWATARVVADQAIGAKVTVFLSGYALMMATEPAALSAVAVVQAVVIAVRAPSRSAGWRTAAAAAGAIVVVAIAFRDHLQWSLAAVGGHNDATSAVLAVAILVMGFVTCLALQPDRLWPLAVTPSDRRLAAALAIYAAAALFVANAALHASARHAPPVRLPAAWRNIERLNERAPREMTMKLTRDPVDFITAVARYSLPATRVHVLGLRVPLTDFEMISRQHPLVIHNFGCEGVGHDDVISIPGVGCALLAPPSVALDTAYPFNRTFLAIDSGNMSDREKGGRWSTGRRLPLKLVVDPEKTPVDRNLYVSFLLNPFLPGGVGPQRLVFAWGENKKGEVAVSSAGWISLPVTSGDWSGNRLWALRIAIDFPDRRTILFDSLTISESARGPVVR